jgi:carboxymethylenebutenolidase
MYAHFLRQHPITLALLLLAGLFFSPGRVQADDAPKADTSSKEIEDHFMSGDATIHVIRFEPPGTEKRPAVIMLHGADGWGPMTGFRFAASGLNASGFTAILVRYYDRTKTDKINDKQRADFVKWLRGEATDEKENASRHLFEESIEAVRDAVAYVRKLPNVDASRIGIVGFSLGGYLALAAAPKCDPPVQAVVEMFGGLPQEYCKKLGKEPPTLIVHGEEDDVVPVSEAYKAAGVILAQKQQVAIEIQKGVGHVCCPPGKDEPDKLALLKARGFMTSFFKKQLDPDPKSTPQK